MEFKKLADVNLLDSAPANATAFAEVNGEVVRVKGGVGGDGNSYIYDFTDRILELFSSEEPAFEVSDGYMIWQPTWEEASEIIEKAIKVDNFKVKADIGKLFRADGDEIPETTQYIADYSGPITFKMYDKENQMAMLFIGVLGSMMNINTTVVIPLFVLEYLEEDDSSPMIMLSLPLL